jgi:hypothetical protein
MTPVGYVIEKYTYITVGHVVIAQIVSQVHPLLASLVRIEPVVSDVEICFSVYRLLYGSYIKVRFQENQIGLKTVD